MALLDEPVRTILLDIEGTTTPLDFVHQVLFPYARSHLKQFLMQQSSSEAVRADVAALYQEHAGDVRKLLSPPQLNTDSSPSGTASLVAYIEWLMARDRKSTPLKSLQGKIWEEGYRSGQLCAPVFDDVPRAFGRWQKQNRSVAIFSSGSVWAQRLLFAHTIAGDLTPYISTYFDTTTGAKSDTRSYQTIARTLRQSPSEIVFISDVIAELDAAESAGFQVLLSERSANHPPATTTHRRIGDFGNVFP